MFARLKKKTTTVRARFLANDKRFLFEANSSGENGKTRTEWKKAGKRGKKVTRARVMTYSLSNHVGPFYCSIALANRDRS